MIRRLFMAIAGLLLTVLALFVYNVCSRGWQVPDYGRTGRPAIIAGDFNANPREAIDLILAPAGRPLVDYQVINSGLSDHLPVLSKFPTAR